MYCLRCEQLCSRTLLINLESISDLAFISILDICISNYIPDFPNFRAQFAENRSIFNTPNPRLMNVTLMKETKDGRHHRSTKKKKLSRNMSMNDEGKALLSPG